MPIAAEEFEAGRLDTEVDAPDTAPVGEYGTERELVLAFLDENPDAAFTGREVLLGVGFDESDDPSSIRESYDAGRAEPLGGAANQTVDVAGDAAATTLVAGDVDETLAALVANGAVERADVTVDGRSRTYYRVARS